MGRLFFITGTDTGVGKTVLTALLLHHMRQSGVHAIAMKPFCSGSREDVELFQALQGNEFSTEQINPFYYDKPLAPLIAARKQKQVVELSNVVALVHRLKQKCEHLLIEGVGGLMVPLGENFAVQDLIAELSPEVILVGRNRLGTINHTLLSVGSLLNANIQRLKVVLVCPEKKDDSCTTNAVFLRESLHHIPFFSFPFLRNDPTTTAAVKTNCKKLKKVLAQILI